MALRLDIIGASVGIVDGYLLSAVLVIFGLGLYELFIGNIETLRTSEIGARLLHIQSIEDLKDRLGRVVLLVLVVKFAQLALQQKYEAPVDLLYLAIGITLIGAGLYLTTHRAGHHSASNLNR